MKRSTLPLFALALAALLLAGCATQAPAKMQGATISGPLVRDTAGEDFPLTIHTSQDNASVTIDVRGAITKGALRTQIRTPLDAVVWEKPFAGITPIHAVVKLPKAGEYALVWVTDGPVAGQYELGWKPGIVEAPVVRPQALLAGAGMMLVGLCAVLYAATRRLGWGYLGLGALSWLVTVVLKFVWAIPVNGPVYQALSGALPGWAGKLIFEIYVGALTGVFEVGLVWLLLRYTKLGQVPWGKALAFGIGFGAIEALLLGLSNLASTAVTVLRPGMLPLQQLEAVAKQNNLLYSLAPIVERAATVMLHILANVLLFYAVRVRQGRWFWYAFCYKTGVDTVAAVAQLSGVIATLGGIWLIEAIVLAFGIVGFWGTRWVARHYPPLPAPAPAEEPPTPDEPAILPAERAT